jgi:hypothetical protein
MKKQKAAGRKTAKKKPALTAKPLRDLGGTLGWVQSIESLANSPVIFCGWEADTNAPIIQHRNAINGVPLPIDLEAAAKAFAHRAAIVLIHRLANPPVADESGREVFSPVNLDSIQAFFVEDSAKTMVRLGFYLAVMRYADELKHVPEAVAMLEAKRRGAKKGGAARRKQAAPNHKAIRRRFKELEKTIPKATARYLRIGKEFGMHEDSVARIIRGESG